MGGMSIYELPHVNITRDYTNGIATVQVGPRSAHSTVSPGKVLMVVGATGAGKTTLINAMVNYLFGVEWEDDFRFKMIVEAAAKDQTKSVTKWITAYTIPAQEGSPVPYTLTIIDTPGFGDMEGIERDKRIAKQVKELFSKKGPGAIDQLHGIGFVTQAPLARLTYTQRYIFDSILAIFGKDVEKNVFMMITFSDGQTPPVLEAVKAANIPHKPHFKFNNSAIYSEDRKSRFNSMFWEMGMTTLKDFFAHLAEMTPTSLLLTKVVLEERKNLEVILQGLHEQIHRGLNKCEELRLTKKKVKQRKVDIIAGLEQGLEQELFQKGEELRSNLQQARKCIERLDEIALKPNPLSEVEYISLMIESEQDQKKPGFLQRIHLLERLQSKAGQISTVRKQTTKPPKAKEVDWWAFWNE